MPDNVFKFMQFKILCSLCSLYSLKYYIKLNFNKNPEFYQNRCAALICSARLWYYIRVLIILFYNEGGWISGQSDHVVKGRWANKRINQDNKTVHIKWFEVHHQINQTWSKNEHWTKTCVCIKLSGMKISPFFGLRPPKIFILCHHC